MGPWLRWFTQRPHRAILLALFVAVGLFEGCGGGGGGRAPAPAVLDAASIGPSSFELIDRAVREGRIDEETGLTYKILAFFGHPDLPAEFVGDDRAGAADASVLVEYRYREREGTLRPDTLTRLGPLFLRPDEPGSYAYSGDPVATAAALSRTGASAAAAAPLSLSADPTRPPCTARAVQNDVFRIQYERPSQRPLAEAILARLEERIWPRLKDLMGERIGPNSAADDSSRGCGSTGSVEARKYDIFISSQMGEANVPAGTLIQDFIPGTRRAATSYTLVSPAISLAEAGYIVSHELMHAITATYDVAAPLTPEYWWLVESTATWAEWHVYPADSRAHRHLLARFFLDPRMRGGSIRETPLDSRQREHQYGAYLWPFFLSEDTSAGAGVVRAIWENSTAMLSRATVNAAIPGGFATQFKEFALQNYNRGPADSYRRSDALRAGVTELIPEEFSAAGPSLSTVHLPAATVVPLAAAYYEIQPLAQVRHIDFRLAAFNGAYPQADLKAIVRLAGEAVGRVEDWSDLAQRTFCRDRATENVEEIVLVVSNSAWDRPDATVEGGDLEVEVTTSPCFPSGTGTIAQTFTDTFHALDGSGKSGLRIDLKAEFTATYLEPPQSMPGVMLAFAVTGTMTYAYEESSVSYHSDGGTEREDTVVPPCSFALAPEGNLVALFFPNTLTGAAGIPQPLATFGVGTPANPATTCPGTITTVRSGFPDPSMNGTFTSAIDLFPVPPAVTLEIVDWNPWGFPMPGVVADTFVGDLAGFDDFKSFEPDAEQVRTYDTHFEFRLPAGQRLN